MFNIPRAKSIAGVCLAAAAVILAYWLAWWLHRSLVAATTGPVYTGFEDAFPVADGWLALCLVVGGLGLLTGWSTTFAFLMMGTGAGAYLFGMDVLYDLQHGIWGKGANGIVELAINVVTGVLTIVLGRWTWTHREALLNA
jgi:hypothetical protein